MANQAEGSWHFPGEGGLPRGGGIAELETSGVGALGRQQGMGVLKPVEQKLGSNGGTKGDGADKGFMAWGWVWDLHVLLPSDHA